MRTNRSLKMSLLAAAAVGLMTGAATSASANADAYLFGYTYAPYSYGPEQLVINGTTTIQADTEGWYDYTGYHNSGNPDYIVGNCSIGTCGGDAAYNDFFTFDLSSVTGPITSAVLEANNPTNGYDGAASATYTVYDVSTPIATLDATNYGATGIYGDLGSGTSYGAVGVGPFDNGTLVSVTFDADGLAAVTSAEGSEFAVGGTLGTFSVPEPASWALMIIGFAGTGAALRSRRKLVSTPA